MPLCRYGAGLLSVVIAAAFIFSPRLSRALEFEYGEINGSFDSTISYGQSYRVSAHDRSIIGLSGDPAGVGLSGSQASITGSAFSEN